MLRANDMPRLYSWKAASETQAHQHAMETVKKFTLGQGAQKSLESRRIQRTQTCWPEVMVVADISLRRNRADGAIRD